MIYMCSAGLLLCGFGWNPGNELISVRIGQAAEGDLIGVLLSLCQRGCSGEGEKSGGGEDYFIHCEYGVGEICLGRRKETVFKNEIFWIKWLEMMRLLTTVVEQKCRDELGRKDL